jgi:hypothetical protein
MDLMGAERFFFDKRSQPNWGFPDLQELPDGVETASHQLRAGSQDRGDYSNLFPLTLVRKMGKRFAKGGTWD